MFKFFYWETGYFNTIDITMDRAGYYLCWGCLVWVQVIRYLLSKHLPAKVKCNIFLADLLQLQCLLPSGTPNPLFITSNRTDPWRGYLGLHSGIWCRQSKGEVQALRREMPHLGKASKVSGGFCSLILKFHLC